MRPVLSKLLRLPCLVVVCTVLLALADSTAQGQSGVAFLRGDCNGDGDFAGSVGDAVFALNFNFVGGQRPPCLAACDADGDGVFRGQVTDAVFMLTFNFLGGLVPPLPYPSCGLSSAPSDLSLGCATQACPGAASFPFDAYAHFPLDELVTNDSGQRLTFDASGNGRHAEAEPGGPLRRPVSAANRFGRIERAFNFSTDRELGTILNLGHLAALERNFTVCAWVRRTGSGGSDNILVTETNWWTFEVRGSSSIHPAFTIQHPGDPNATIVIEDTRTFGREEWHFVAAVVAYRAEANESTIALYRDGLPVAFNTEPIPGALVRPGGPYETTIGGQYAGCSVVCRDELPRAVDCCSQMFRPLAGDLDDVRLYGRALGPGEISMLFEEGGCQLGADGLVVCP